MFQMRMLKTVICDWRLEGSFNGCHSKAFSQDRDMRVEKRGWNWESKGIIQERKRKREMKRNKINAHVIYYLVCEFTGRPTKLTIYILYTHCPMFLSTSHLFRWLAFFLFIQGGFSEGGSIQIFLFWTFVSPGKLVFSHPHPPFLSLHQMWEKMGGRLWCVEDWSGIKWMNWSKILHSLYCHENLHSRNSCFCQHSLLLTNSL